MMFFQYAGIVVCSILGMGILWVTFAWLVHTVMDDAFRDLIRCIEKNTQNIETLTTQFKRMRDEKEK